VAFTLGHCNNVRVIWGLLMSIVVGAYSQSQLSRRKQHCSDACSVDAV